MGEIDKDGRRKKQTEEAKWTECRRKKANEKGNRIKIGIGNEIRIRFDIESGLKSESRTGLKLKSETIQTANEMAMKIEDAIKAGPT
ncbi:hypothetical protein EVAR_45388_1 [Eumeta japonica]|uniref:Uncharacterized protein n=1 Tax=Eumeta variegata TaxID=151549 RepID=A0A4C1WTS3_EUMVA|nr:hypothetical protein EVAR_45388_1 [Eumeta japonica]